MALLNANYLGLYTFGDSGQTSAYRIESGESSVQDAKTAFLADAANGEYGILVDSSDNVFADGQSGPAIGYDNNGSWVNGVGDLELMAAATSTSLDLNNSIDEVVARDGDCGSETFIVGGAQSWSLTADGLIQDIIAGDEASGMTMMDYARNSQYVLVRFVLNNQEMDDAADNQENVNYIGQGIIENVSLSGGFDETSTYSVTIRGYGKLYKYQA